jgi:hypothetical protein
VFLLDGNISEGNFDMLFNTVFKNPKWRGQDEFPSCDEWKSEYNKWLVFVQNKGQLERYLPRINDSKTRRDEAFAEIASGYILETRLNYPVIDWERKTVGGRDVDFVICDNIGEIYCEVKSPGWESEITQEERRNGRKDLPKYISGDGRAIAPWQNIRYAIKKAYPKFLPTCKNLVVMYDDLFVPILDTPLNIDIALSHELSIYGDEKGYFTDRTFENIGGVLFLDCKLPAKGISYRYNFIANPNAREPISLRA